MEETEAILPSYVQNYENFHPNGGLCFRASELNLDQQRRWSCTEGAFAWAGPIIAQLDKNEPITDLHSCERRVNEKLFHVQSEAKIGLCPGIETSISENIPHVSASRMAQRDEFQRKYYHFVRLLRQKSYVCSTVVVFQKINRFSWSSEHIFAELNVSPHEAWSRISSPPLNTPGPLLRSSRNLSGRCKNMNPPHNKKLRKISRGGHSIEKNFPFVSTSICDHVCTKEG